MEKSAFIFPGQGSQYVGMGRDIYEFYPEGREVFEEASTSTGIDLKTLCFSDPDNRLELTSYTQPAILTTSLAIWACIGKTEGEFLAGHSLGEFTAYIAGGALDLKDGIKLVLDRGRFMQEAFPRDSGAMAAIIGLEAGIIDDICKSVRSSGRVWPANYNCPGQIVITGEKKGLLHAIDLAKQRGAKRAILLSVSIPSHCPLMEGAAQRLSESIDKIIVNDLKIPVLSNCWAIPVRKREKIKENMIMQLTSPVRWEDCIRYMINEGVKTFVEVGPGGVLTGIIKRIDKNIQSISISDANSVERFKETRL